MIRGLVDFALNNRWLMIGVAILLFAWGIVSFHNLPVEAYPDVANNYVQVITQWPGRAAEEVEQQVTVPIEIQMAGIPHMQHLRSTSLAGLSSIKLIFDDDSTDKESPEGLAASRQVTLPAGLQPQMGTDWSPVGQIYWYTLRSTNPAYDNMELKSIEDWKLEKQFKSVPGVVDVSSFGGITREYQVRLDPDKLIAYGLSIGQVEQQLANNNVNAGGNFIEQGEQQINVREVGLFTNVHDIEQTVLKSQNGTALRVKDIATVVQGPKIRLGQIGKTCRIGATPIDESDPTARPDPCVEQGTTRARAIPIEKQDGKLIDNPDMVEGIVLLQKGDDSDATLEGIHKKVAELNGDATHPASFPPASRSFPSSTAATYCTTPRIRCSTTSARASSSSSSSCFSSSAMCAARSSSPSPCLSPCSSPPSAWTCAASPPTFSRSARWTSAWWWTAPW